VIEVEVVGIRLELPANQPVLVLRDLDGTRYLPLWIGNSEATAISLAVDGIAPPRPLTHDLLVDIIEHLDDHVLSTAITELVDGVYYAQIEFANHGVVSARPSDAVALALRCDVPIFVSQDVLDEAGMDVVDDEDLDDPDAQISDSEVEKFRAFLDEIKPEDFS
jgi:bifunctional DNase/RNase